MGFLRTVADLLVGILAFYWRGSAWGGACSVPVACRLQYYTVGLVIGAGLLGACSATAAVAWAGRRIGYRAALVSLSLLAALGGLTLAALPSFPILLTLVFVGMVNGMGTDRSAAFALEQAIIPGLAPDKSRIAALFAIDAFGGGF